MNRKAEILEAIKKMENHAKSNPDKGFQSSEEASTYVSLRMEHWGSNLIGWVVERGGRFFPCFNVWD
jgi:hypothetical protein